MNPGKEPEHAVLRFRVPEATPAIAVAVDANGSPGEHGNLRRRRTVGDVVKVEEMAHGDEMKKIATIGIAPGP